jgi:hypothetical protein
MKKYWFIIAVILLIADFIIKNPIQNTRLEILLAVCLIMYRLEIMENRLKLIQITNEYINQKEKR